MAKTAADLRTPLLATMGGVALIIGLLVYLADRHAGHSALIPAAAVLNTGPLFGVLGAWLPSFVHPFAFSLFTASVLPFGAAPAWRVCAIWWAVDIAFECLQHPTVATPAAAALNMLFGHSELAQLLTNYMLRGTFDLGDLVAATAGAMAAALLLVVHPGDKAHDS